MTRRSVWPLAACLALVATSCSASESPDPATTVTVTEQAPPENPKPTPSPEQEMWSHGAYKWAAGGTTGTILMPAPGPADLESLRKRVGGPESTYVNVHVDNRQGADYAGMYELHVFTPEGDKFVFESVTSVLDSQWPETSADDTSLYNQSVDIYNKYLHGAEVGEVKDIPLVGVFPELPDEIARATIYPFGAFDAFDAYPEEVWDEQAKAAGNDVAVPPDGAAGGGLAEGTPEYEWLQDVRDEYPETESWPDEEILFMGDMGCMNFDMGFTAEELGLEMYDPASAYIITSGVPVFCPEHEGKL